jgi:serine/threonine protein kinase
MNVPPERRDRHSDAAEERLDGRVLAGKYVVLDRIGAGAMGAVYRARHTALDKIVAVKVLHRPLVNDPELVQRFQREALAASRLDHPNSIRVLDFGQEPDGVLFIAMDYLDGRDLLKVLNDEWPLPVDRVVGILAQTLSALAMAHDLGVLHRDLKPENVMILRGRTEEGAPVDLVKVCDFGIAKIVERSADPAEPPSRRHSTGGVIVGTPAYMAPEQATGAALDPRADLYSIGIVLYQMLTGRPPFDAAAPLAILIKQLNEAPVPPSTIRPDVDPRLEAVCLRALRKNPDERYQNAREMRSALRSIAGEAALQSSPASAVPQQPTFPPSAFSPPARTLAATRPTEPSRRVPAPLSRRTIAAVTALGIAAGVGALASRLHRTRESPDVAVASPASARTAEEGSATAEREEPRLTTRTATADPLAQAAEPGAPGTGSTPTPPPSATAGNPRPRSLSTARPTGAASRASAVAGSERPEVTAVVVASVAPPEPAAPRVEARALVTSSPPRPPEPASDPKTARVVVGAAKDTLGTTPANVGRAIAPVSRKFTDCYRDALLGATGRAEGAGVLHVETDEAGVIVRARFDGPLASTAGRCIAASVRGRSIPNVDTGVASASIPLALRASP